MALRRTQFLNCPRDSPIAVFSVPSSMHTWLLGPTSATPSRPLLASPDGRLKFIMMRSDALPGRYLRMTKSWGLHYWRRLPLPSLPVGMFQILSPNVSLLTFPEPSQPTVLAGYVDAAHATDLITRRSTTGIVLMFCGGPLAYKSKIQSTVFTSSTEAEFLAAVDAAKIAKYLRSILAELGYPQHDPTCLYEDNAAAILMINASRPTPRSRHIDIQHFAMQEWKAKGDIILEHIPGMDNSVDSLTKSLGTTLHHRHVRRLMGHFGTPWVL